MQKYTVDYFENLFYYEESEFLECWTEENRPSILKIRSFKKELEKQGYLQEDEKLNEMHAVIFDDIMVFKKRYKWTWGQAVKNIIEEHREFFEKYNEYKLTDAIS